MSISLSFGGKQPEAFRRHDEEEHAHAKGGRRPFGTPTPAPPGRHRRRKEEEDASAAAKAAAEHERSEKPPPPPSIDPVAKIAEVIEHLQVETADAMEKELHISVSIADLLMLLDAARKSQFSDQAKAVLSKVVDQVKIIVDSLVKLVPEGVVTLKMPGPDGTQPYITQIDGSKVKREVVQSFENKEESATMVLSTNPITHQQEFAQPQPRELDREG